MASCARKWRAGWLLLHAFASLYLVREGRAQNRTCLVTEQPALAGIDPPSGTGEVRYTITGSQLDQIAGIEVTVGTSELGSEVTILESNANSIQFTFSGSVEDGLATVTLQPNNSACNTTSGEIDLRRFAASVNFISQTVAQPGTTINVRGCFPSECGDNSTMYSAMVGDLTLELLAEPTAIDFLARFPNSNTAMDSVAVSIVSDYQTYMTTANIEFFLPGTIMNVQPSSGQNGTRVTITGDNLLGVGDTDRLRVTQVEVGGSLAAIVSFNQTEIVVTANTGTPGESLIRINTTQTVIGRLDESLGDFDGPYIYVDGLWTQLENGVVTEVVPPAAQSGRTVSLCGQRLLGGGNEILQVNLAGQIVPMGDFLPTPFSMSGVECINVTVPETTLPDEGISDTVMLTADSGAIVQSESADVTFSYAVITSVSPSMGQFGTEVTIQGLELLSGYSAEPNVYLAGVRATVRSSSDSTIVVQAEMPPDPEPTSGMMEPESDIFGMSGDVEVTVNSTGSFAGLRFTVSAEGAWTYETPGEIEEVIPPFGQYGTLVTITGTNLFGYGTSIVRVTVNGTDAIINEDFSNEMVIVEAPNLSGVGLVPIVIFSDTGAQVIGENQFEYRERGRIDALAPDSGQNGTYVTITGTNLFGHSNNITDVMFGDTQATIDYSQTSDSEIRVRIQPNENTENLPVAVTILAESSAIVASDGEVWTYLVQGAVVGVAPAEGQEGTSIEITGTNLLGGGSSVQSIFLDGVPGTVTSDPAPTATSITVVVMAIGDRTDFFSGQVFIMADTGAVVIGGTYTHRASGQITSFFPRQGREGTRITVNGEDLLGFGTSIIRVEIAGIPGMFEGLEDETVIVRAGAAPDGTLGGISLIIDTGAVVSSIEGVVFTYDPPGMITAVEPVSGAEGTGVLLTGNALQTGSAPISSVTIGGSPVSRIVTSSETEISVIAGPAPAEDPSNAEVVVTATDGSFIGGAFFEYVDLTVSLRNLNTGQEGTRIEIVVPTSPLSFTPSTNLRVFVGSQEVPIESVDIPGGFITVRVPRATLPGTYTADVAVESPDRLVARLRDGFTYIPEGVIYSVTPNLGQLGTMITLEGENLLGGGEGLESDAAVFTSASPAVQVQAAVDTAGNSVIQLVLSENPEAVPVDGIQTDIILTADTGAVVRRLNGFTLVPPGAIASISPTCGQFATRVVISGSNLIQGGSAGGIASITLAGVPADVLDSDSGFLDPSDTEITVSAASSKSVTEGEVEIVFVSGAFITAPPGVTFQYFEDGVVTKISPGSGPVGTRVNILGDSLLGNAGFPSEVRLAGIPANITSFSPDSIDVIAGEPVSPTGNAVEVIANTGAIVTGMGDVRWTYETPGTITSIDPMVGRQGIIVTIRGDSLIGPGDRISECFLSGVPGEVMSFNSSTVMCEAGFNSNSQSGTNPDRLSGPTQLVVDTGPVIISNASDPNTTFTYYIAAIDRIEPTSGMNGTLVNISGLNLAGVPASGFEVTEVMVGGIPADVISSSNSEIQARVGESSSATIGDTVRVVSSSGAIVELSDAWNYTEPGQIEAVTPEDGVPGDTIVLTGENIVPPCVPEVRVILGQTEAYTARVVNTSRVEFRPGVFQASLNPGENLDSPGDALPVQVIAGNGATVYTDTVAFQYGPTGTVTSISPIAGVGGMEVLITGVDLLSGGEAIRVTLAGVNATIVNASETEVLVMAGEGPLDGVTGGVVIEANNSQLTGVAGNVWSYFPVVTAAEVSPQAGQNGTAVTLNLTRIQAAFELERVLLAGVIAELVGNTTGVVMVEAGESEELPLGNITLEFAENLSLVIPDAWSYQPPVRITSLSQDSGYFNSQIVITGENFQPAGVSVDTVYLAGLATNVETASDTEIAVRITQLEDSSAGAIEGPIVVRSDNGATFTSQLMFTYVQLRVDSVDPTTGQGGTVVTVRGVGLAGSEDDVSSFDVSLGGVAGSPSSLNNTQVVFTASPFPSETNVSDIEYVVNGGATVTIPDSWRYVEPGEITGVSPAQGSNGTIITITGRMMFAGGSAATSVQLGTATTSDILVSDENLVQVRVGVPGTLGLVTVTVIADTGAETVSPAEITFEYLPTGIIASVSPMQGQNGTRVTIRGTDFRASGESIVRVLLAGVEAVIEEITDDTSDTVIIIRAGRPSTLGTFAGVVTIETERGTTTISSSEFRYLAEGLILSVDPPRGQTGTRISITGENLLGGGSDLDTVYIGGVEAMVNSSNDNSVNVTAGRSSEPLTGDIVLISDSGAYVRRIDGWTYVEEGVIETVDPPQGQYGTRITITGMGLLSGGQSVSEASIGGVAVLEVTSSSDTVVVVRAGQPAGGNAFTGNITLVSNFGGALESNVTWNYLQQSIIFLVTPPMGIGMTNVTVTGRNLLGGGNNITSVMLAGISAVIITEDDSMVFVTAGVNANGEMIMGSVELESDTGARTVRDNPVWIYMRECPAGQFGNVQISCSNCSSECEQCFGPEDDDCTECVNFAILDSDTTRCVSQCPNVSLLNKVCVDICGTDQYARTDTASNLTFCNPCSSLCDPSLGCSGPEATQCGGCLFFYNTVTQSCVEQCPNSTFADDLNNCVPCNSQCVAELGCRGASAADCNQCLNVRQTTVVATSPLTMGDLCLAECPTTFYLEETTGYCLPCSQECAGNCTGPTPYDCFACLSFAVMFPNGTRRCVPTCNPDPTRLTMYDDINAVCQPCSSLCSQAGGCIGPTASDCLASCAVDSVNNVTLPTLDGECRLSCPNLFNSTFYYEDSRTSRCEECDISCDIGCTAAGSAGCIVSEETELLGAGPVTIAIVVVICAILFILLVTLVACLLWRRYKYGKYEIADNDMELGDRYSRAPRAAETAFSEEKKKKTLEQPQKAASPPVGAENAAFDDGELYTEMGPDELEKSAAEPQHGPIVRVQERVYDRGGDLKKKEEPEAQELYTDMEPLSKQHLAEEAPIRPPKATPAKKPEKTPAKKPEKTPAKKPEKAPAKKSERPPAKSPSTTSIPLPIPTEGRPPVPTRETKAPPRPPSPELYTDMQGSIQEVYVNPEAEEYSEMAPSHMTPVADELYDDALSVQSPTSPPVPTAQQPSRGRPDDQAPLLSPPPPIVDSLYEDADTAVAAAEHYRQTSSSSLLPPQLPSQPIPKKRLSQPLPATPLEQSLKTVPPKQQMEDLYEQADMGMPIEESLYEAIPTGRDRLIPDQPSPAIPPKGSKK